MDDQGWRAAVRRTWAGELPARYRDDWLAPFDRRVAQALFPGAAVLDVGGGRAPSVPAERRPPGCRYVGLDLSARELALAPPGSYDETVAADVTRRLPELEGRFDLAVSWQVLEHVRPLAAALENLHAYLRPGGTLVALLSSGTSAFAVANRILPERAGAAIVARVMRREPETVHPAHYDHCTHRALSRLLAGWSEHEIEAEYRGAEYFRFSRVAQTLYVAYEEWAFRGRRLNLATHYRLYARR